MTKALVLLANGSEETEFTATCDILTRAGVEVCRAAVVPVEQGRTVHMAYGMDILANVRLEDVKATAEATFDIIILPGGRPGTKTFTENADVQALLKAFAANPKKRVAAICAAPSALRAAEIFKGSRVICYPEFEEATLRGGHFILDKSSKSCVDGRLITSHGPTTALDFGMTLAKELMGKEVADRVAHDMLMDLYPTDNWTYRK